MITNKSPHGKKGRLTAELDRLEQEGERLNREFSGLTLLIQRYERLVSANASQRIAAASLLEELQLKKKVKK
jgi:hypothetical protein